MKKKFTFIDVIIIFLAAVILIGGSVYLYRNNLSRNASTDASYGYTLRVANVKENITDMLKPGAVIIEGNKLEKLGTIDKVEITPYKDVFANAQDGSYVTSEVPDKFEAIIHLTSDDLVISNGSVQVNGNEIYYGKTLNIRGANFACVSTVWALDEEVLANVNKN